MSRYFLFFGLSLDSQTDGEGLQSLLIPSIIAGAVNKTGEMRKSRKASISSIALFEPAKISAQREERDDAIEDKGGHHGGFPLRRALFLELLGYKS